MAERLIQTLNHRQFDFYVHLDKKVDAAPFSSLERLPNTSFVKERKTVNWAGFSQLEAVGASLRAIFASGRSYDYVNLLSGQDYPIKPTGYIYDFLNTYVGHSFLASETPPTAWWDEAHQRYTRYHLTEYGFRGKHRLENILSTVLPQREFPLPYQLYGGPAAAYWTLSGEAAFYLSQFLTERKFHSFFKHTWAPDEFLVNTLLMNSPFSNMIINDNYRHIDRSIGGSHPKVLTMADLNCLQHSSRLFARKFDPNIDNQIQDEIDATILYTKNWV
ncbi:beta-1,6-N-acetylglucosaminyltransferase [Chitinophaga sp.]|uniref:beta-1,6-N-acetylglucosaminyltransferase n=1 Tax=Chitinophaga sp. TaxID=1869181 RepID=UPI0031D49096